MTTSLTSLRRDGHLGLRVLREGARARSESSRRYAKRDLERGRTEYPDRPEDRVSRPHTVGDCEKQDLGSQDNPCPWVSCPYHLYLDVDPSTGSIKFNFPDKEIEELEQTCCLRAASGSPNSLEHTGELMNVTRERIRQIESKCLEVLREQPEARAQAAENFLPRAGERH